MKRTVRPPAWWLGVFLVLCASFADARPKIAKLSKKLLYGDEATKLEAVNAFNKLPSEAQYKLVPDFMVALTDEDPKVRKIASRILKAMGVKTEAEILDVKKEPPLEVPPSITKDRLDEEKKVEAATMPELPKPEPPVVPLPAAPIPAASAPTAPIPAASIPAAAPVPVPAAAPDRWSELKNIKGDATGNYADLKQELEREKRGQVTLDIAELRSDSPASATPLSTVVESLKDSDPWVRAQAARRLAMVHPAPVEAIPTLITMLRDSDVESRRAAAAALGSFGPLAREAAPALNAALSDPDNTVSQIAAEALKQIQQPR